MRITFHTEVFLKVVSAPEGSDIYAVRERLEQKVLDERSEIQSDKFDPRYEAICIFYVALQSFYKNALTKDGYLPLPEYLKNTLNLLAYENWEARQKFGIKGSAVKDWLHASDGFAEASFNLYCSIPTDYEAVQS